jgi:hypothetical protein
VVVLQVPQVVVQVVLAQSVVEVAAAVVVTLLGLEVQEVPVVQKLLLDLI